MNRIVNASRIRWGTGDFEPTEWDIVTFIRYRSRADFLEFILESDWNRRRGA
jgi:hypothetical protein